MRGAAGHGGEEVGDLAALRHQGAVSDRVGRDRHADVAFVLHIAFRGHVAAYVVGIDGVGPHAHRVRRRLPLGQFVLGHHEGADHATGFADVDLMGPVAVVLELVFRQAPAVGFFADVGGHARVVGEEPEQALLVGAMFGQDLLAALIRSLRVVVIHPDIVEAERTMVVRVGLPVGQQVELAEGLAPAGVEDADDQLILRGVVVRRLREGDAVVRMVGRAPAVAIGLHALVTLSAHAGWFGRDAGQQAGRGVAGHLVGADRLLHRAEVVTVMKDTDLVAVPFLAVDGIRLAADMVADACCRQ